MKSLKPVKTPIEPLIERINTDLCLIAHKAIALRVAMDTLLP